MSKMHQVGTETVAGMKAKVMELAGPNGQTVKVWVDEKYGLMLKMGGPGKDGRFEAGLEVTQFTAGKPPSSVFEMPARCAQAK